MMVVWSILRQLTSKILKYSESGKNLFGGRYSAPTITFIIHSVPMGFEPIELRSKIGKSSPS